MGVFTGLGRADSVARVIYTREFLTIAGPVPPDHPSYIRRDSDDQLLQGLRDQRFCYVLGPHACGKSSLMTQAVRALRSEGHLAAVVDLAQTGIGDKRSQAGRWYYSIAYRIVRDLRLKVDLQSWWQSKSGLMGEQRLTEFFLEIVLANTSGLVTIVFDQIEEIIGLPFTHEFFLAICNSYKGRATEPDYARLNFVVLGVAIPQQLCKDRNFSPFDEGLSIEAEDFSLQATYQLAVGLEGPLDQNYALFKSIYAWASGHPYLTQKIARAVLRQSGILEDVDQVISGQFLTATAVYEEPLLSQVQRLLKRRSPYTRQVLVLLGKIGEGAEILSDPDTMSQQVLRLSGLITVSPQGQLRFRNKLFQQIFTSRWAKVALPFEWRAFFTTLAERLSIR